MSYSFVRKINPAFAGFGAFGALDYNAQYAAWQVDYAKWKKEEAAYKTAKSVWAGLVTNLKAQYVAKVTDYQNDLKRWNAEAVIYTAAMNSRAASIAATTAARKMQSGIIAKQWSLKLPADYTGCVLQFWHDQWVAQCTESKRTTIMGLGATPTGWGHPCGTALLPICTPPPPMPYLRPKPVAPPVLVLPPEPTLRAEPKPPIKPATPPPPPAVVNQPPPAPPPPPSVVIDTPPPSTPPTVVEEPIKQANMIKGGLLAIVVVGGGYLLYRTFKKPKAKAA